MGQADTCLQEVVLTLVNAQESSMNSPVRCAWADKGLPPSLLSIPDLQCRKHSQMCLLYILLPKLDRFPPCLTVCVFLTGLRKYCVGAKILC